MGSTRSLLWHSAGTPEFKGELQENSYACLIEKKRLVMQRLIKLLLNGFDSRWLQ
jgi:hypothetical protein